MTDVEHLIEHYKELSETVSGEASVGEENAQIARRVIAKIKADALREAAEILPAPVGLKCNAECHDADRITLRIRADRIEEEA